MTHDITNKQFEELVTDYGLWYHDADGCKWHEETSEACNELLKDLLKMGYVIKKIEL